MRAWALLLGGLLVWAAHFFLAYAFASLFPGKDIARWLALGATVVAMAANLGIFGMALVKRLRGDDLEQWQASVAAGGAALSFVAVAWQGLPAIIS